MNKKIFAYNLCAILFVFCSNAEAQQPTKTSRIGFLSRDLHPADSRAPAPINLDALRQGLQELGYIEGKNLLIEYGYAEGRSERLPTLAEERVHRNVELIVAETSQSAVEDKKVSGTIPIVIASGADPVAIGLVSSLARRKRHRIDKHNSGIA